MSAMSPDVAYLPKHCPEWCLGGPQGHLQALQEGCDIEDASRHLSLDVAGQVRPIPAILSGYERTQRGGWNVEAVAEHVHMGPEDEMGHVGRPMVRLAVHEWERAEGDERDHVERLDLSITSGEARTLARQLLHLADRIDLHI